MKGKVVTVISCLLAMASDVQGFSMTEAGIRALYNSLDEKSVSQHLAFCQLYPDSKEAEKALDDLWELLNSRKAESGDGAFPLALQLTATIDALVGLVNKNPGSTDLLQLTNEQFDFIETVASGLAHKKLRGHSILKESDLLQLEPHDIDLGRAIFLCEFGNDEKVWEKVRSYEAMLDIMALQLLARLKEDASPEQIIDQINELVFQEMGFRFPPNSTYAKDIDRYTFLPSVLDKRRGVCLGVSILYLCLAQRLGLELEMITPPGHIFVRWRDKGSETVINIETTARGINLPSEVYLGVDTRSLQQRNIKEVIGLAYFNQASVYWRKGEHEKALESYHKALPYLSDDMLLKELMAYNYLFVGEGEKAKELLDIVKDHIPDYAVAKSTVAEDWLAGKCDAEGIKALFSDVEETREALLKKKDSLIDIVKRYPFFRAAVFHLASIWLQLNRQKEALQTLLAYHELEKNDPMAEYILSALCAERFEFGKAWEHLKNAQVITAKRDHHPKALKELYKELKAVFPFYNPQYAVEEPDKGDNNNKFEVEPTNEVFLKRP